MVMGFWRPKPAPPPLTAHEQKKVDLTDAIVLYIQCDGCMAHVHNFKWIGRVVGFEMSQYAGEVAVVDVFKDGNTDWRDGNVGVRQVAVADGSLQKLGRKFFVKFA